MRPVLSPLPFFRVVTAVMAMVTILFAAQLSLQWYAPDLTIASRYADSQFQQRLFKDLQLLESSLRPGPLTAQSGDCPPRPQEGGEFARARLECARMALNTKLAGAKPLQHIADPGYPAAESLTDTMQWLARNAHDGNHLLALLHSPAQTARQNSMPDPFRLPGCIFAGDAQVAALDTKAPCSAAAVVTEADLPPQVQSLLYPLQQYRAAVRGATPNTLWWQAAPGVRTPIAQGRHIMVAWDARTQAQAQLTASCYAGAAESCRRCPWCNTARADSMFEAAGARAIGILIVDVPSGAIEALASAYTPCYAARQRGGAVPSDCPTLPDRPAGQPPEHSFRLGSQALVQTAMPGSQAKIPIALGLMQAGLSRREVAALPGIITRSATEELIDIVLCKEAAFLPACAQQRLASIRQVAAAIGWQNQTDVLTLGQVESLNSPQFGGRLMQLPASDGAAGEIPLLDQAAMRECGAKPVELRWRNCRGAKLVNTVAELFGQGNALASPLGIADGMLHLAAVANGETVSNGAHLLLAVQDSAGATHRIAAKIPLAISRASALPVIEGLSHTHLEGTARSSCMAARAALKSCPWAIPCSVKEAGDHPAESVRIASKTGTPVFSGDRYRLPQWRAACTRAFAELAMLRQRQARWYYLSNEIAKCQMAPIKWYSMLVGLPGAQTWDKVVVVIAERNWNRSTLMVDSPGDIGANVAAEAGLALANALYAGRGAGAGGDAAPAKLQL